MTRHRTRDTTPFSNPLTPAQLASRRRIQSELRRIRKNTGHIPVELFCQRSHVTLVTLNRFPDLRERFNRWQSKTIRQPIRTRSLEDIREELSKNLTYRTVGDFCLASGRVWRTLIQYPVEYAEIKRRVASHSLETDEGYSFRHPHAIEARILEALEDGALELQSMVDLLKLPSTSKGSVSNYRRCLDQMFSARGLYRYERLSKYGRKVVTFSLEPLDHIPVRWEDEEPPAERKRKQATKSTPKAAAPPVEELIVEGGKTVGKIVTSHDQPPMTVWFGVPRELAG